MEKRKINKNSNGGDSNYVYTCLCRIGKYYLKVFNTNYISFTYFENKEKFIFTKRLKWLDYDNSDYLRKIVCYILIFLNNEK